MDFNEYSQKKINQIKPTMASKSTKNLDDMLQIFSDVLMCDIVPCHYYKIAKFYFEDGEIREYYLFATHECVETLEGVIHLSESDDYIAYFNDLFGKNIKTFYIPKLDSVLTE